MSNLPRYSNCVCDHRYWLGSFRDWSGNSNHGTPTGVNFEKRPDKHVRYNAVANNIAVSDSSELQLVNNGTLIVYGDFANQASGNEYLLSKYDGGGTNYRFYLTSSAGVMVLHDGSTVTAVSSSYVGKSCLAVSFTNSAGPIFYLDGSSVGSGGSTLNVSANDAPLIIGNLSTGSGLYTNNPLKGVLIYNVVLTPDEISQVYDWTTQARSPRYPKKNIHWASDKTSLDRYPVFVDDLKDANESIAANTSGNLENTVWKIDSGEWKISRNETQFPFGGKAIECTSDGILYTDSTMAYGTWEFDYYKNTTALDYIRFIADNYSATAFPTTPDDGYMWYITQNDRLGIRETGTGFLNYTASSYISRSTWYRLKVTRSLTGSFSIYIKGGSFSDWTLVNVSGGSGANPVTDTTTTTSKYFVLDLDAGDKVANFNFYQGVI